MIGKLLIDNYIKEGRTGYVLADKGCSLRLAKCIPPINRAKAEVILSGFMERVEYVNENEYYLYKVAKIVIFGSYANPDAIDFADIDIAIELEDKFENPDEQERYCSDFIGNACMAGKRFSNIVEQLFYPMDVVRYYLKHRQPYISLHSMDELGKLNILNRIQIYPEP